MRKFILFSAVLWTKVVSEQIGVDLDASFFWKKSKKEEAVTPPEEETKPASAPPVSSAPPPDTKEPVESSDESHKSGGHDKIVPDKKIAAVTSSSSCTVTSCSDDAYMVTKIQEADWYDTYVDHYIKKAEFMYSPNNYDYLYGSTPTWTKVELRYCIQFTEKGDNTHYSSYFLNIPAGRRYFLLLGQAIGKKKSLNTHKAACNGKTQIRYRYLTDFFRTGDDYTQWPEGAKHLIDDTPPTTPGSTVNYREGHWLFDGSLIGALNEMKGGNNKRPAYWFVDATLLELVDAIWIKHKPGDVRSAVDEFKYVPNQNNPVHNGFLGMIQGRRVPWPHSYHLLTLSAVKRRKVSAFEDWPEHSFWQTVHKKGILSSMKEQKDTVFDETNTEHAHADGKRGVYWIAEYEITEGTIQDVTHLCLGLVRPFYDQDKYWHNWFSIGMHFSHELYQTHLKNEKHALPPDMEDSWHIKAAIGDDVKFYKTMDDDTKEWAQRYALMESQECHAKVHKVKYLPLWQKFVYKESKIHLPIVACGLFPKTLSPPKNCKAPKRESEGTV